MLDTRRLVVADLRDADRMTQVFGEHRPQVVFHAAALKHLPLLEMHPCEAVKTNVDGHRRRASTAARSVDVERFVNISTDKAADPISVLGYTKRICERLTAAAHDRVRRHLPQRALRQRARQPRQRADRLPRPDRRPVGR